MNSSSFYCGVFGLLLVGVLFPMRENLNEFSQTVLLIGLSTVGSFAAFELTPHIAEKCIQKGLYGLDINKGTSDKVAESNGLVTGLVFMFVTMIYSLVLSNQNYTISLLVIVFTFLIGVIDDFLDIRWRYKLILSFCASILVVVLYPGTTVLFGYKLSWFYLLCLVCLSVFFANSINMYAGVNGLESGQCLIISAFAMLHNVITLFANVSESQHTAALASLQLLIPFFAITLVLFYYNKFPSKVFVGDSFTYFSGGVLGVASIIGGYDRLMLCLFMPELINFVISIPQLFGFIFCPRHRLPKLNKETGKLECVKTHFTFLNLVLFIFGPKTEHELVNLNFVIHSISCVVVMILAYTVFSPLLIDNF
ncbi:glucosaminephosphotransferase, putative [Entamoeba invadens IP1]|uniref:UDP-N-acetylglucosamine--dolichyl-phosphate N-acetylglucosaminephosphotransferase n=1 Tax=Entamoeba invadens IP1 TaxID=370355 RepID=A0A0A1TZJ6_ENTIV|nr:glucosaminephosphotransferase, putative [Entamoeba invadens IP1]ELP87007.1 glucosaminephosphotransferase, putative [Entamoeba invadens IP1]|eukprot:XP_004253778.1 glucosaminephosphotransferase, putative [Entamoeba invadens IP1]